MADVQSTRNSNTTERFDPCVCGHEHGDHANLRPRGWCDGGCGRCGCLEFRRSRRKADREARRERT
jgi:hypothetical protein